MDDGAVPLSGILLIVIILLVVVVILQRRKNIFLKSQDDVSKDGIIKLADKVHMKGIISKVEEEMIINIMDFESKNARDVMTHRKNVNGVEADTPLCDAFDFMLQNSNTRYPVYRDTIDNIIGIIHLKDAASLILNPRYKNIPVEQIDQLVRDVGFIPEGRSIASIFTVMQSKNVHFAVVIDEYGQTSGIITLEDILEEIVGNIQDEYDENDVFITPQYDNSILMDGLTPLEQVASVLDIDFGEQEVDTLNGYLTSLLGHIPTEEDRWVDSLGYHFQILSIEDNIIQQLRVTKIQKEEGNETCQDIQNSQI